MLTMPTRILRGSPKTIVDATFTAAQNRSLRFIAGLAWAPVFSRLLACGISQRPDRSEVRDNN